MNNTADLPSRILRILNEYRIYRKNTSYLVAVSGGVDSMLLLHILAITYSYHVIAAHVNYGKRGEESDADETLVRSFCAENAIPLKVLNVRNTYDQLPQGGNFQDQARKIRRRFFCRVMDEENARAVFLAHHRDDHIETVYQKLMRGAAPEYWTGMQIVDMPWVRPLLPFKKSELLAYAQTRGIPYRTDTTNLRSDYARNMLRNEVFPHLEAFFPGWRENLLQVSRFGSVQRDLLDYVTDSVTVKIPVSDSKQYVNNSMGPNLHLNRSRWLELPESLHIPVARHWIRRQSGFSEWSRGTVNRLADLKHLQTGGRISITDHISVLRDRDEFVVPGGKVPENGGFLSLEHPEIIDLQDMAGSKESEVHIAGWDFCKSTFRPEKKQDVLQLRWDCLRQQAVIRLWQEGDRIRPLGMTGYQSVADHLTNRKISTRQKKHTLVLVSFDDTVHAVIFPHPLHSGEIGTIAEHARCQSTGQCVLLIKKPGHST